MNDIKIVTDSAANNMKAFKSYKHYICLCHRLNTAIEKAYAKTVEEDIFFASADKNITSLIGFANRTNQQNSLPMKLKSGSATRPWRRYCDKFSSVFQSYQALQELSSVNFNQNYFFYFFVLGYEN